MKPNFALSLSFEGISLLCRVENGWHVLGEVALTTEDLAGELEKLKTLAEEIGGADFRTKLVLPNDQIKYLKVDSGRGSRAKRETAVVAALEEETPYAIDELSYDIAADGRTTHVAAVARETLAEAEAFAVEHRFNPVAFVAIPPEDGFPNEPAFGLTEAAKTSLNGDGYEPDTEAIRITGSGPPPVEEIAEPAPEPVPAPEPEPVEEAVVAPPEPEAPPVPEPVSTFSSIRARRDDSVETAAPTLGRAERRFEGINAPGLPAAGPQGPHGDEQLRFDPAKVIAGLKSDPEIAVEAPPVETSESEPSAESSGSFFSRRKDRAQARAKAAPEPKPNVTGTPETADELQASESERDRMTVFGAREKEVGGKPRHLGLILTVILLLFLAGVAVWASVFLDEGLAGLFRREPVAQIAELEVESKPVEAGEAETVETAPLAPANFNSLTDSAEIEAMTNDGEALELTDSALVEAETDVMHPSAPSKHEAEARYAVTGIWERAPDQSLTPPLGSTETLYLTSIDRLLAVRDAVALPSAESYLLQDWGLPGQASPPAADAVFDLDERGLVRATPEGSMSPNGVMVYLGKPPALPKSFPERQPAPGHGFTPEALVRIGQKRPRPRPDDLIEQSERASYGGRTLQELVEVRPRLRPELDKAEEEQDTTPTEAAVLASARPRIRPSNFAQIVARATPSDPVVATPVAATVTPDIPTSASVARQATIQNAINLNKISLIGVYGTTTSRRALVRMSNGRFKKVQVGDRLDGGKVAAISDTELRYVKSGKNVILKMPKG